MLTQQLSLLLTVSVSAASAAAADWDAVDAAYYAAKPSPPPGPPPSIAFNVSFGDNMVLQQAPAKACVYGVLGVGGTAATITIKSDTDAAFSGHTVEAIVTDGGGWKACLAPAQQGGSYTITATCTGCTNKTVAVISDVTFGDVWYCSGQSNMALPLAHTLSRNISRDAILAGKYSNIRIHGMAGNMNPFQPWATLKQALSTANDSDRSQFAGFSSTCYYFGESLTEQLGDTAPPIGLINTAWGGSQIEQWLDNVTIATCGNASIGPSNQQWHDERVMPYIGTTVKGFVWYQGENDMHGYFGNSALHTGYSCMMQALVNQYRSLWSTTAGTTGTTAPFGLVTLPSSGGEGGASIGTMRWAQTASYGTAPNPALPNVFVAQGFDLGDMYSNDSCYGKEKCHDNSVPPAGGWGSCTGYCESVRTTNWYLGPIHPRDKKPVGDRLAQTGIVVAYGGKGWSTGPQISGCAMSGTSITVTFNKTLMAAGGNDAIEVQPYYKGGAVVKKKSYDTVGSMLQVLTNASDFCMQDGGGKGGQTACRDDGTGHPLVGVDENAWVAVDVAASPDSPNALIVDLSKVNGTVIAIRYGWVGDCCTDRPPTSDPCPVASCPLMGSASKLPANPFIAHVTGGKCKCVAPQVCDE